MVEVTLVRIAKRMLEPPLPRGSDNRVQVGMGWHPAENLLGPAGIGHQPRWVVLPGPLDDNGNGALRVTIGLPWKESFCLLLLTRCRHQLPPHPFDWFRNLITCLGGSLRISSEYKDGQSTASG